MYVVSLHVHLPFPYLFGLMSINSSNSKVASAVLSSQVGDRQITSSGTLKQTPISLTFNFTSVGCSKLLHIV